MQDEVGTKQSKINDGILQVPADDKVLKVLQFQHPSLQRLANRRDARQHQPAEQAVTCANDGFDGLMGARAAEAFECVQVLAGDLREFPACGCEPECAPGFAGEFRFEEFLQLRDLAGLQGLARSVIRCRGGDASSVMDGDQASQALKRKPLFVEQLLKAHRGTVTESSSGKQEQ